MADPYNSFKEAVINPARNHAAVVTHNTNALTSVPKALFIGTGGNIALRAMDASADVLFKNVPSGSILPVRAKYVRTTNTTAADIVALY